MWPFRPRTHDYDEAATSLGRVLQNLGYLTEPQLKVALLAQENGKAKLGDLLVEAGVLTAGELAGALDVQTKLRTGREAAANMAIARRRIDQKRTTTAQLRLVTMELEAHSH